MGWVIYNSQGEPLVTQEDHDHTAADGSGPMTNDEHDGYSEYGEIAAPGAGAANKGRLYAVDRGGYTTLEWVDSGGVTADLSHTPTCSTYNSASYTIPNSAWTSLTWNSESWDTDTMHSTAANTDRITPPTAGIYMFSGTVLFASSAGGNRRIIRLAKNGALVHGFSSVFPGVAGTVYVNVTGFFTLNGSTDYVSLYAWQDSGGALTISHGSAGASELSCTWIAPQP